MQPPKKNEVRKPTRTISGITPVAIMLPPKKCKHGSCIYCPNLNVPQSYTPKSPVVLRAKALDYDSYKQVKARIQAFKAMNHPTDKIEIIIMGGTFLEYPKKFQYEFVKGIYNALNSKKSKTLSSAKKLNESSKYRCVALCIETRPDVCCRFIDRMREFGCTRVELGVQIIDDKIYKLVKRGHKVEDVANATKCLKNAGFKVGYHIMPGLPGSNLKKDFKLFKKLFSDEKFKPDQLKLYPCQVMPGSELEEMYWNKKYKPYTKKQIENILVSMLKEVPRYCRVMRVMREIPPIYIVAGTKNIDLRKPIEEELRKKNVKLKEIRYREVGFNLNSSSQRRQTREVGFNKKNLNLDLKLKTTKYKASGQDEYFLEIVNKEDILFGLLRLRIIDPSKTRDVNNLRANLALRLSDEKNINVIINSKRKNLPKAILEQSNQTENHRFSSTSANLNSRRERQRDKLAIIRELHIYGQSLKLGQRGQIQHKGLGKQLMQEAEKIAKQKSCKQIKVISGIGVREYYKRLGYELEKGKGECMVKDLS